MSSCFEPVTNREAVNRLKKIAELHPKDNLVRIQDLTIDQLDRLKRQFSENLSGALNSFKVPIEIFLSQSKSKMMKKYTYNFTFEHNEQKKSSSVSLFANDILDANEKFAKLYSGDCGRYGAAQCNGIKMNVTGVDVEDIPVLKSTK